MDDLLQSVDELNELFSSLSNGAGSLSIDLRDLKEEFQSASQTSELLSKTLSKDISTAMKSVIIDGGSLSDTFGNLALSIAKNTMNSSIGPLVDTFSGWAGSTIAASLPFGSGAGGAGGQVQAFAKGGVVNSPTHFPMGGGVGLMGEAGPEAIMPLTRGPDGKLGVASESGGRSVNIVMNITTNDANSFKQSQNQITSKLKRTLNQLG